MSFTGILGLVMLGIIAIALLGPSKLPAGVEQVWLMLTNYRRSQAELPTLTLEQARRSWESSQSPLYDLVQILYASVEHLVELRHRIFVILIALGGAAALASLFANQILDILIRPKGNVQLAFLAPTDMVMTYIEIIFSCALIVALPVLVFEILMFIRPALESPQELSTFKWIVGLGLPLVVVFFLAGLTFAYFILLPFGLQALAAFGGGVVEPVWSIRYYNSFVLAVLLWIGLAFETPLVMALLARLGMVSPQSMMKQWRYALVGIAIAAVLITPTVDPINMMLVMAPLALLYFLGVLMARAVYRPRTSSLAPVETSLEG